MGTEFSILTGKLELLVDGCSPGKHFHTTHFRECLNAQQQVYINNQVFIYLWLQKKSGILWHINTASSFLTSESNFILYPE